MVVHRQSILLIITLILLVYANSFSNQFVFDDITHILLNKYIHKIDKVFEQSPKNYLYSRPLTNISLSLDYQIWRTNPFGYHITNFLIHLVNSTLLYWIILKLWGGNRLALISALLFSLHPINTEAVSMIALGRGYLLATFFSLLSWLFYLKWHLEDYQWKGISLVGFISCWSLAVTANELGFIFPLFLLVLGFFQADKKDPARLLVLAASTPLLLLLILSPIKTVLDPLLNSKEIVRLSIIPYLMARYIKLMVLPYGLSAWYEGMQTPSWSDYEIIISVGIISFIAGSMPILNRYDKRFAFPLGLLLCSLFIVSFRVINNPTSLMGERWVYLSSIGFSLFLALIIDKIWESFAVNNPPISPFSKGGMGGFMVGFPGKSKILRAGLIALFSGVIFIYGLLTFIRNQDWKDEYTFWAKTVEKAPNSGTVHYNLGYAAHKKGYIAQAEEEYNMAIEINPLLKEAHNNIGILYMKKGETDKAIKEFKKAIELYPRFSQAYNNLGSLYTSMDNLDLAEVEIRKAININPENSKAHYNLGIVYKKKGLFDDAVSELKKTIQIDPGDKEAMEVLEEIYKITKENRR